MGNAWISLNVGGGSSWALGTTVDLATRRDGAINSSPVSATFPVQVVTQGCPKNIPLRVEDPNKDVVRCRWAAGNECASVCGTYTLGSLDQVNTDRHTDRHTDTHRKTDTAWTR